ncbi:hypothetical protein ACFQ0T_04720 [Kitasatospora gansuensis]
MTTRQTLLPGQSPQVGGAVAGRMPYPPAELVKVTRTPWMSAGSTPAGKPGLVSPVGVPLTKTGGLARQPVVQTSTCTRSAPLGKVIPASAVTVTASKKSGSVSVTISRFRPTFPLLRVVSRSVTSCGVMPVTGRSTVPGASVFCSEAAALAGFTSTAGEQLGLPVAAPLTVTAAQLVSVPEVTPGRSRTVTVARMKPPGGMPSGSVSRTPFARASRALSGGTYATHALTLGS